MLQLVYSGCIVLGSQKRGNINVIVLNVEE